MAPKRRFCKNYYAAPAEQEEIGIIPAWKCRNSDYEKPGLARHCFHHGAVADIQRYVVPLLPAENLGDHLLPVVRIQSLEKLLHVIRDRVDAYAHGFSEFTVGRSPGKTECHFALLG